MKKRTMEVERRMEVSPGDDVGPAEVIMGQFDDVPVMETANDLIDFDVFRNLQQQQHKVHVN